MAHTSRKPVTVDELDRLMMRVEDVQATAAELARRLEKNGTVEPSFDSELIAMCMLTGGTMIDLASVLMLNVEKRRPRPPEPAK